MDEATSMLDPKGKKEINELVHKLNKEKNITIIMATHDLDEINHENVRIICLAKTVKYDGNIENWKGY